MVENEIKNWGKSMVLNSARHGRLTATMIEEKEDSDQYSDEDTRNYQASEIAGRNMQTQ
jgi:hypothetical protein